MILILLCGAWIICLDCLLFLLGTERCNEALKKLGKKFDIVVNIQGDEPLIEPEIIDGVVKALQVFIPVLNISFFQVNGVKLPYMKNVFSFTQIHPFLLFIGNNTGDVIVLI